MIPVLAFAEMDGAMLEKLATAARVVAIVGLGLPLLHFGAVALHKLTQKRCTPQTSMLVRKGVFYTGVVFLTVITLGELGFKLGPLLGAAGVFGIAIGFASQTSVSNIISGLFLVSEKPFAVGDVISVGSNTGIVLSIDLLSVKLRLFDNKFVRIPNETLIKTPVTNITRYPIRRFDIDLRVGLKEDLGRVRDVLLDIANGNPLVLDEPEPLVLPKGFGESGVDMFFAVWFAKDDFLKLRQSFLGEIKKRFDSEGIEIPLPHRVVLTEPERGIPPPPSFGEALTGAAD